MTAEQNEKIYFTVADRQMEIFLEKNAFEKTLIPTALFQPNILVPDIFFFISEGVEKNVLDHDHETFFEACISEGIIIPDFRDGSTRSFTEDLEIITKQKIQGVRPRCHETAKKLQTAAEKNMNFSPLHWPDQNVSEKFAEVVKECLGTQTELDTAGLNEPEKRALESLWNDTLEWRTESIDEARQNSPGGLMRGEIMNAVGYSLGFPRERKVDDWSYLIPFAESKGVFEQFIAFSKWINECYHLNQAREFGAYHDALQFDPLTSVVTKRLLNKERRSTSFKTVRKSVLFPNPLLLARHPRPSDLLRTRLSPLGSQSSYLTALEAWQRQPDSDNERELLNRMDAYSKQVRKEASTDMPLPFEGTRLDVIFGSGGSPSIQALREAIQTATTIGASPILAIPLILVQLGRFGYSLYVWYNQRPRKTQVTILSNPRSEVHLPTSNSL